MVSPTTNNPSCGQPMVGAMKDALIRYAQRMAGCKEQPREHEIPFWVRPFNLVEAIENAEDYEDVCAALLTYIRHLVHGFGPVILNCPEDLFILDRIALHLLGSGSAYGWPPGGGGKVYCPSLGMVIDQSRCPDYID